MEQIGNINVSFNIFSQDPQYLHVGDLSDWVYSENMPSYILVTIPGSKKPRSFVFLKHKINTFNSHNLGISCKKQNCKEVYIDLPDGIYTICVKSGFEGIEKSKFYLKTDRFEIEVAKIIIKDGIEYNESFFRFILKVKGLLEIAKYQAMLGNFVKAQRYFEMAKKELQNYNNYC